MSVDFEVLIIGAGPAGLTAAYCLAEKIQSVAVIEKDPIYVGGISRTVIQGFPVRYWRSSLLLESQGGRRSVA